MTVTDVINYYDSSENNYEELLIEENDNDVMEDSNMDYNDDNLMERTEERPADATVPPGWSCEGVGSDTSIRSPGGELYKSRRHALVEMVNSGECSEEEINVMKSMLKYEGWRESDKIPRGWMMRDGEADQETQFLGLGGELYNSLTEAVEFVEKYKKYFYQEDINKIRNFQQHEQSTEDLEIDFGDNNKDWIEKHPSVPTGWLFKQGGKFGKHNIRVSLMSPNGKFFPGRRPALKFMIEEKYPEEQIREMRKCLKFDGWLHDKNLPENWFYKFSESYHHLTFIDPCGNQLKSREEAHRSLEFQGRSEHLKLLEQFCQSVSPIYEKGKELDKDWILDHPAAPPGWMVKEVSIGSKKVFRLLSPGRNWFPSHKLALKHMIDKCFSEGDIEGMRNCMKFDDWISDPLLPEKWMYRPDTGNSLEIIDETGHFLKGREASLKHLEQKGNLDSILAMKQFLRNTHSVYKNKNGKNVDDNWSSGDKSVPEGWLVKTIKKGANQIQTHVLSPDRIFFSARRNALKYMIEKRFPESDISKMREGLKVDGWFPNGNLPINWLHKSLLKKESNSLSFLDSDGNYFRSREDAFKFLKQNGDPNNDIQSLKRFFQCKQSVYGKEPDDSWIKGDSSVPEGWMIKTIKKGANQTQTQVLSPDRIFFAARRLALKHMIEKKMEETEIEKMRRGLETDGWKTHQSLPDKWLYKYRCGKRSLSLIDSEADYFKNKESAIRSLKLKGDSKMLLKIANFDATATKSVPESPQASKYAKHRIDERWVGLDIEELSGWKYKPGQQKYLSPSGDYLNGRLHVLKFMMNTGCSKKQMSAMNTVTKRL